MIHLICYYPCVLLGVSRIPLSSSDKYQCKNTTTVIVEIVSEVSEMDRGNSPKQSNRGKFELLQDITMYGILISVLLGFVLNTLSLIVLITSKNFSSSIGTHLKSLAVADNIQIIAILFRSVDGNWEKKLHFPVFYTLNDAFCMLISYLLSVGRISTGVILASATVERFLAVAFPLKFKSWNLNLLSKIVIGIYFLIAFGISIIPLIAREIAPNGRCVVKEKYDNLVQTNILLSHSIFANGICGGSILLFNTFIIASLFKYRKKRDDLSNTSSSHSQKEFQITIMLLVVACLFIILRLPKLIILNIARRSRSLEMISWSNFTNVLVAINHSINFVIYFIFLKPFRDACVNCLYLKRRTNLQSRQSRSTVI